jgi:hypothetical protein
MTGSATRGALWSGLFGLKKERLKFFSRLFKPGSISVTAGSKAGLTLSKVKQVC